MDNECESKRCSVAAGFSRKEHSKESIAKTTLTSTNSSCPRRRASRKARKALDSRFHGNDQYKRQLCCCFPYYGFLSKDIFHYWVHHPLMVLELRATPAKKNAPERTGLRMSLKRALGNFVVGVDPLFLEIVFQPLIPAL